MKPLSTLALLITMAVLFTGCGYGEISPAAYDYSMAMYAISNRQATDKLDGVSQQIEASLAAGELTAREAAWLEDIIQDGRRGEWKSAAKASRRMMEDQVRR